MDAGNKDGRGTRGTTYSSDPSEHGSSTPGRQTSSIGLSRLKRSASTKTMREDLRCIPGNFFAEKTEKVEVCIVVQ